MSTTAAPNPASIWRLTAQQGVRLARSGGSEQEAVARLVAEAQPHHPAASIEAEQEAAVPDQAPLADEPAPPPLCQRVADAERLVGAAARIAA
jgi:hypothetical protein